MRALVRGVGVLVAGFLAAGAPGLAAPAKDGVSGAWVRVNPAPGRPAAGYLTMRNGAVADALVAASAPGARVELHTMAMDGGVMKMRALERLPMAAGETVALKPGGAHLMFYGLERPGRTIPVTLQFASGATVVVEAEVRQAGAEPNPHAGH